MAKTDRDIPVSPLPRTADQNATSQQPGTETGLVVTPLPWPHSTSAAVSSTTPASITTPPQENLTTTAAPMKSNQCKDCIIFVIVEGILSPQPPYFLSKYPITLFAEVCLSYYFVVFSATDTDAGKIHCQPVKHYNVLQNEVKRYRFSSYLNTTVTITFTCTSFNSAFHMKSFVFPFSKFMDNCPDWLLPGLIRRTTTTSRTDSRLPKQY